MTFGEHIKHWAAPAFGVVGTTATAILNHVNVVLGLLCGTLTVTALAISVLGRLRAYRSDGIEMVRRELQLCRECRDGRPPKLCPLAPEDRPKDCPMNIR